MKYLHQEPFLFWRLVSLVFMIIAAFIDSLLLHFVVLERSTWREVQIQGLTKPLPRYGHSMTISNDKLIVFGGMEQTEDEFVRSFNTPPIIKS